MFFNLEPSSQKPEDDLSNDESETQTRRRGSEDSELQCSRASAPKLTKKIMGCDKELRAVNRNSRLAQSKSEENDDEDYNDENISCEASDDFEN